MRLTLISAAIILAASCAAPAHAEYVVLRTGQRLNVTGYQLVGDVYRLQLNGGSVEIAASEVSNIEPEEVFVSPPPPAPKVVALPPSRFSDLIDSAAKRYAVDAELISSVIAAESNFNPRAVSRRNARGLMQLMPRTASTLGVRNVFDPTQNIDGGTRYLRDLLLRYQNDITLTLAAYNAGPEKVQQYGAVPPFAETISYVRRVKQEYAKRKTSAVKPVSATPKSTASDTSVSASSL